MRHVAAVEVDAFVICVGMVLWVDGPARHYDGVLFWFAGQPVILAIAIATIPVGLLLRAIVFMADALRGRAALGTGALVGVVAWALLQDVLDLLTPREVGALLGVCILAGALAGWVWFRLEPVEERGRKERRKL